MRNRLFGFTARNVLSGDLVQIGNHGQEALRGGEGRGQCAGLQGAVDRTGGPAFQLHLRNLRNGSPEIRMLLRRPLIGPLAHRRGGRNRIDGDYLVCPVATEATASLPSIVSTCRAFIAKTPHLLNDVGARMVRCVRGRTNRRGSVQELLPS